MLACNTLRIRASVYGMTEEAVGEMGDGSGERWLIRNRDSYDLNDVGALHVTEGRLNSGGH